MGLTIENYMILEKVYISVMVTIDNEFVTTVTKWADNKSIYDANDEKSTSSFCW